MRTFILTILTAVFFFSGCADKQKEVYNKPAIYWYNNILDSIKRGNLEKADDYYTSLASEHAMSPLLKESMLILAHAHSEIEEHILAEFYLDEFIKRFGDSQNMQYIKFLKLRAKFKAFKRPKRDQKLLDTILSDSVDYIKEHPDSIYNPLVNTILVKTYMSRYLLDKEILELYKRMDRNVSIQKYQEKLNTYKVDDSMIIQPEKHWYRYIFE
jgi:outer membrane protein assembly factor BamD